MNDELAIAQENKTVHQINYDGRMDTFYPLWLTNFFLYLITLTVYRFWGKTNIRRYTISRFELANERFEYLGTGGELAKRFAIALLIGAVVYLIFVVGIDALYDYLKYSAAQPLVDNPVLSMSYELYQILLVIAFILLSYFIVYGVLRYFYSRITYRGIRSRIGGSAIKYAFKGLGFLLLRMITLNLLAPRAEISLYRYRISHTYYGNARWTFDGQVTWSLFWVNALTMLPFILIPIMFVLISFLITKNDPLLSIFFFFLASMPIILFIYLASSVTRNWYRAKMLRHLYRHTRLNQIRLKCTYTGWALFKNKFINLLILIVTLGLAYPFTIQRNLKLFAKHVSLEGDIDTFFIEQSKYESNTLGEGFDDAFGTAFGIDAGLSI